MMQSADRAKSSWHWIEIEQSFQLVNSSGHLESWSELHYRHPRVMATDTMSIPAECPRNASPNVRGIGH